jgi:hypothetical protein
MPLVFSLLELVSIQVPLLHACNYFPREQDRYIVHTLLWVLRTRPITRLTFLPAPSRVPLVQPA